VSGNTCASNDEATEGDSRIDHDKARTVGALGAGEGIEVDGEAGVVGFDWFGTTRSRWALSASLRRVRPDWEALIRVP
jgi:hypothetical protein